MKDIIIRRGRNNCFIVDQGDKTSEEVGYDEMLGLISALTIKEIGEPGCIHWMKTPEQHKSIAAAVATVPEARIESNNEVLEKLNGISLSEQPVAPGSRMEYLSETINFLNAKQG